MGSGTVDTKWFKERAAQKYGEPGAGRKLSRALGLHESVWSRMINAGHGWDAANVAAVARELKVDPSEVLYRVGADPAPPSGWVRLSGWIDEAGSVHKGDAEMPKRVPSVAGNGSALLVRAPFQPTDGWVLHYDPASENIDPLLNRLCVVELDSGGLVVGVLRRAYVRGRYSVTPLAGVAVPGLAEVDIRSASPVRHTVL